MEEEYTRNKIRHGILPVAKDVCSGAVEHVAGLAEYAGEVEKVLERLTEELLVLVQGLIPIIMFRSKLRR